MIAFQRDLAANKNVYDLTRLESVGRRNNHKQFYALCGLQVCGVCDGLVIHKSRH